MRHTVIAKFSLPAEVWKHIREITKAEKRIRSEVVREALEKYYVMRQWKNLQELGARQANRLGIWNEDNIDRLVHEYRGKHK